MPKECTRSFRVVGSGSQIHAHSVTLRACVPETETCASGMRWPYAWIHDPPKKPRQTMTEEPATVISIGNQTHDTVAVA